jgi:hypothetical protein
MSTETDHHALGFRFYDPLQERSATERKARLGALEKDIGFDNLRQEFAYQLHVGFDQKILDPKTDPQERQVLVAARQVALNSLEPSRLVDRGVKRAIAAMKQAEAAERKRTGING